MCSDKREHENTELTAKDVQVRSQTLSFPRLVVARSDHRRRETREYSLACFAWCQESVQFSSVQFSSVQDGVSASRKGVTRSTVRARIKVNTVLNVHRNRKAY